MMPFLRKDLRLLLRNPGELALLLLMPLVLIAILGFALGGLLGGNSSGPPVHITAALVNEDTVTSGRATFLAELADSDLPAGQRAGLMLAVQTFDPVDIIHSFITSEDLGELLTVSEMTRAEADAAMQQGEVQAAIVIPSGFSALMYGRMLLGEGASAELQVQLSDDAPLRASIVRDILTGFAGEFNLQTALQQVRAEALGGFSSDQEVGVARVGGVEVIATTGREVSAFAYYAFGMAAMFMLYLVGNTAGRAYLELSSNNYDRIVISGASPLAFLTGKAAAAGIVAFLQAGLLIVVTSLLFGVFRDQPVSFWLQAAGIAAAAAAAVGSLAALVTSLVFRYTNRGLADAFNSVIVFVFATVGGSFVPLGDGQSLFSRIGDWTPNGSALSGWLAAAQGAALSEVTAPLIRLVIIALIALSLALVLFPRMRRA